ncbi:L-2-hydroxyglutarate oxidase [Streptomyces calidiresistens]|uniref:L-2-hydroxyglutarate oxidase n=1 Tax=Streptomyces calidiresistens TaxID=1485586 RepID=A0A7W3XYH6_9ACTN|nr:L-2-hydroxyglutarate oxidase [Streptomyces calidiresistens]MBB0231831.1 L-2-hydroxyglutarate oxidase [Streptomyces calidiresistens]
MADETVGIVGAGIVGLAVGREITLRRPGTRVVVLEKEGSVGVHQTGHNSGVVHAGIYYPPGSLKARLCARGRSLLREYCAERALPYEECGKLVVAIAAGELPRLDRLDDFARANGVPGLRRVTGAGITEVEPHATGVAALHSPRTAITDFVRIAEEFGRDIVAAGGEIRFGRRVTAVRREPGGLRILAAGHAESVDRLVVCAGLHADRVGRLVADSAEPRIIPFRGEYMRVRPPKAELVRGMIYPVPDPRYPFLGVHFTRRVDGGVEVGPNAVPAAAREGYRRLRVDPVEVLRIVSWPGTARLAARHWRTALREVRGSLSVRAYMRDAQRYVPGIGPADVERDGAGVRAQALDRDGTLVDDFRVHRLGAVTVVRNAPSPAATSSMAIAEHVVDAMTADRG